MKRAELKVRERASKTSPFWIDLRPWGVGKRYFKTQTDAKKALRDFRQALNNHGKEALQLPAHELAVLHAAQKRLALIGKTVPDAVEFLIEHDTKIRKCNKTVRQLADELVTAKKQDGCSRRHTDDLRIRLARFCEDFGERLIASITFEELDSWLRALPFAALTRTNYRRVLCILFSYAKQRKLIDENIILDIAKPKVTRKPPEIFTLVELRTLLETARDTQPDILPFIAIGAFAGLRRAEIERLDWSEVNLQRKHIEIPANKAKGAQRRLVPIQPNLAEWLRNHAGKIGPVIPANWRKKIQWLSKDAGITWKNNALRHSFASYHLAHFKNQNTLATDMGHTNSSMIFQHYREVVTPSDGEFYWQISPAAEAANVVTLASAVS